jgi:hypothetical protein
MTISGFLIGVSQSEGGLVTRQQMDGFFFVRHGVFSKLECPNPTVYDKKNLSGDKSLEMDCM